MASKHLKPWIWQRTEWPEFRWDSARLVQPLAAARRAQGQLMGMARLLDPDTDLYTQLEVLTSEGVATSAIEGEHFDPNALRSSLARRLGLPSAGFPTPPRSVSGCGILKRGSTSVNVKYSTRCSMRALKDLSGE